MIVLSYYFLHSLTSKVVEEPTNIGFGKDLELKTSTFKNAIKKADGIELRGSADGGSLITFSEKNTSDDWSFEFTINNPHLHFPENAGVYIWYTDDVPDAGDFNGVHNKFKGMMAGIEFLGKFIELSLASNDGELNAKDFEDTIVMKDSIDPKRFENIEEFRIKLISTNVNFKIEIYDGDKLVYDNLRYLNVSILGDLRKGKHFSITTTYEKVPLSKHITLSHARAYKRTELEGYDPLKIESEKPQKTVRMYDEVFHYNKNIQHLISNLENFAFFMRNVIGEPMGRNLLKGLSEMQKSLLDYHDELEKVVGEIENDVEPPMGIMDVQRKIDNAKIHIDSMISNIYRLDQALKIIEIKSKQTTHSALYMLVIGFLVVLLLFILKKMVIKLTKPLKEKE
ncbi:hypothetical protein EDEG_02662 [Edhazardia aedis USNM 41457]|uniref:L-type lectin-like domain-containing protein n=1 Tax=Edhazardia aedis (strain USNM 41457) TaxID=1003232 RepID=J9DK07_EDHAE|nr:hypothetical protein EDEG_02662 [Edhazardia aedis USNM 41457]|eukprot:EJW02950.1 hypothetical protein EDEG_02662 [Edhazardia aedis USNM 41457]